jgi:heptosyltransferase I
MKQHIDNPSKLLVIDFGQLGDVVLSLPALRAIRERFPKTRITVAVGKSSGELIKLSGYADETLMVDRVALRDGFTPLSIVRIFRLVQDIRKDRFDFVIDLHSLSETNLLGFLSGARNRLYSRRPGRSLDFLSNVQPRPPVEDAKRKRAIDRNRVPRLPTRSADDRYIEQTLRKFKADSGSPLVGLFPGAGHASRRWPLERFAELAEFLIRNDHVRVIVFAGPEEDSLVSSIRTMFPATTVLLNRLSISQLASAQARLAAFVSNDTGPMHIASAVGTPVVLLLDKRAPETYLPLGEHHRTIYNNVISEIALEEVYEATRSVLASGRTTTLFAS